MSDVETIDAYLPEMTRWRQQLHRHPELAFEEFETSRFVADQLRAFGVDEVHEGIAGTGVVGVIRSGSGAQAIGLRADMDALEIQEESDRPWASVRPGKMHACGHDGHTVMLLGAARYLAAHRGFDGTVYLIFQPAEEGAGGGRAMVEDGLFRRFPMQSVYAMHNTPGMRAGTFASLEGPMMASADVFEIGITGRGGHAAMPHRTTDPIVVGVELVQALQTIVSRTLNPQEPAVVSVTQFHAGSAWNVIPGQATLRGTVRAFSAKVQDIVESKIRQRCAAAALAHDAQIQVRYERQYPPVVNTANDARRCMEVARDLVGAQNVMENLRPGMGSEDFAFMLQACAGAYVWIGNGVGSEGGCTVHNPGYDFNDAVLGTGAAFWARLVRHALPAAAGS